MSAGEVLAGRAAVITGAGGGLGERFAHGFARAGARVVVADLDAAAAERVADAVRAEGGAAVAVAVDVADEASTRALASAAADALDGIDVLVNNAAVYAGLGRTAFDEIEVADWDRVMAVNARGPWLCARACAAALRASACGGAIVNVASATVFSGSPLFAHYVASKGALIALTRVLARELGEAGVRANAIAPGFTLTDASRELMDDAATYGVARAAIKRAIQPQDIVGAAIYLASDAAAMITGQTLVVDGGRQFI
jgi:NAD(P)-dependent dehydrogenase (short-subunit alcohol dehydrogenase family)